MNLFPNQMGMSAASHDTDDGVDARDASRIYVGNLTPKANEVHLKNLFVKFGVILSIWVARKPPGFAFVHFETREAAQRAVDAFEDAKESDRAMEILGKPVKVQMAGEKKKKAESTQEQAVSVNAREDCSTPVVTTTDLCRQHRQDARVEAAVSRESRDLVASDPTVEVTTNKHEIENLIDDSGPIHEAGEGERHELVQVVAAAAEVQVEEAGEIEDVEAEAQAEVARIPGGTDENGHHR